jgi:uncharacterized membrane protein
MSFAALILVILGSVFHLLWNVSAKQAIEKLAYLWLAMVIPGLIGLYYLATHWSSLFSNQTLIYCLVFSALIHVIYFWVLTKAYLFADLSFVYPYCRAIGTLLTVIIAMIYLQEMPSILGMVGIILTIIALVIEPLFEKKHQINRFKSWLFTTFTGITIAGYLVVDKIGLRHMKTEPYLAIMFLFIILIMAPFLWWQGTIKKEFYHSRFHSLKACFSLVLAYALILKAMEVAPISYVAAARSSGIVVSGLAGHFWLNENVSTIRWISILLNTVGVLIISLA